MAVDYSRPFIEGNRIYGRVVAVETSTHFPDEGGKWSAFLAGRPWQYGEHQWVQSAIYVAPVDAYDDEVQRCLMYYGNLQGAVRAGNVVDARVRARRGQLVVVSIENATTSARIENGTETFGGMGAGMFVLALLLLGLFAWGVLSGGLASGIASVTYPLFGAFVDLLAQLLVAFAPVLILLFGFWLIVHIIFP